MKKRKMKMIMKIKLERYMIRNYTENFNLKKKDNKIRKLFCKYIN